ncbi:23S rRNA (guanosine(2251)-2'-O)-methyltransferase RlmB [Candidatus Phytoplasma melaleucae]|uniref:23S rRNA (Guanosine(2251)-2'-O)-methyltransferase RlmB n=1 Tax=Candidatus Phytoplasma melaleucae TaxID=2982630 RepID=A0ABT9DET2_9MOLU|nr:23S rRNA (guanosine(2251)-2'-O)-methyltransferase RlmB ['Melaleuca sp.' phytoplasma]MDO8168187.1 23S rRNA (guanosine(2251)-2'-O)-methyltransferase RlmB ['Melaleuca sp.' phytoplasma]
MIIYGKNIIKEAIKANRHIYKMYIDIKMKDISFLNFLQKNYSGYILLNKHQLNEKAKDKNHQGVIAEVEDYSYCDLSDYLKRSSHNIKFLILDEIHDPHNFGAILRTIEATDFDGIIIGRRNQILINGTVAKTSSGALEYVNIFLVKNLHQTILQLKQYRIMIIGTDAKADLCFNQIPKSKSLAIILGNEGMGIRPLLKKNCDLLAKIPMKGQINSLNVSVSAAIILFSFYM